MIVVHNDGNTYPCEHCGRGGNTRELVIPAPVDAPVVVTPTKVELCMACLWELGVAALLELCRSRLFGNVPYPSAYRPTKNRH